MMENNVFWQSRRLDGEVTGEGECHNIITTAGKNALVQTFLGRVDRGDISDLYAKMGNMLFSTGTTDPAASDVNMANTTNQVYLPLDGSSNNFGGGYIGSSDSYTGVVYAANAAASGSGLVDGTVYAEVGLVFYSRFARISTTPPLNTNIRFADPYWGRPPSQRCLFARAVWPSGDRPTKNANESLTVTWRINVS